MLIRSQIFAHRLKIVRRNGVRLRVGSRFHPRMQSVVTPASEAGMIASFAENYNGILEVT